MKPTTLEKTARTLSDTEWCCAAAAQIKNFKREKAVSVKESLLGKMSHALRTPLNAIIGFSGTLLMELPGPLTGDQREQLELVRAGARQQLALINDLLDLVKIETGTFQPNLVPIDASEVIKEVVDSRQPLAKSKGLSLAVQFPENGAVVETDHRVFRQILIKLVDNAIKFTSKGGVQIDLRQENGTTEIAVGDTGIGIEPADQTQLFVPFAQLEHLDVEREEGTGLGLHLSQKLAGMLNARITVESTPGRGSTFTLILDGKTNGNS